MQESDGSLNRHANQQRVRVLSSDEYNRIIKAAFGELLMDEEPDPPASPYPGFAEDPPEPLRRDRFTTSRVLRDRAFSKTVGEAYGWRCSMTGIGFFASDGSHELNVPISNQSRIPGRIALATE